MTFSSFNEQALLQLAASVESGTNHPLATAILEAAQQQELPLLEGSNFHTKAGLGASACIKGQSVLVGNEEWLKQHNVNIMPIYHQKLQSYLETAKSLVYVAVSGEFVGTIALQDRLRPDAQETITGLQTLGLQIILLTGDRAEVAQALAQQLNITQVFAEVRPEGKADIIKSLQSSPRHIVAMVGDGINDAPALAQADIGIALGGGTEIAMETAQIVLTRNRLLDVAEALNLSLKTFNKIRQNLFWAFGYNLLAIPIAAGILLPQFGLVLSPALSGAMMALSSVMVVTNSLLLRYQFSPTKV